MNTLLDHLRRAARQLRKSPGFTMTAVLTLAIGIGATTAIFTLVYDVLLKPLPYSHPEQLVVMEEQVAEFKDIYPTLPMNVNHFLYWQQHSRTLQTSALMEEGSLPLGLGGHPMQIGVLSATPGIFEVLDTQPRLGRAFSPQEAQTGHEHVAVLMDSLWRQQYQSDPAILGKTITLNGFPYTVIGVMPPSFHLPHIETFASQDTVHPPPVEALLPKTFSKDLLQDAMGDFDFVGLARLRPGFSAAQANAEVRLLQREIMGNLRPEEKATLSASLTPFQTFLVGTNRKPLLILLGAVACLLLVGCVNITNLLLARAAGRRQQMAVAAALGAGRGEMLRMAMRETVLLSTLGGALGILLAMILVPAMQRYLPTALDFRGPLHLDWAGAICAVLLAMMATLLAAAIPAWIMARTDPQEVLHSESRLASESRNTKRMRRALVAGEVAVSVALVLLTGLVTVSIYRLLNKNHGFQTERVMTAMLALPTQAYSGKQVRLGFYKEVLRRLASLPGAESAALVSELPLSGDRWLDTIHVAGDSRPIMQMPIEHFRWISPEFFQTVHLPLASGRLLTAGDEGKNYAVISELTARTLWPGKDAVGQQFERAGTEGMFTVIGVVRNARVVSLASPDPMMVYLPYWYRNDETAGLLVRTREDPTMMANALRRTIWGVNSEVPVPVVRTLGGVVADSIANRRFEMDLLLLFAVSALLLAGLGVYGVVAYSVVQRHREIGLRLALGAQRASIYGLVLRDGLAPVLLGAVMGIAIAFSLARAVRSLLFEISPHDTMISTLAVCVLLSVGIAACLFPARRAASVDPMEALRRE